MITFSQMVIRLAVALFLGAIMGLEREAVRKEAGIRTEMLVAGGAAIFTIIGLALPYIITTNIGDADNLIAHNSGFLMIIANIVVGIGFLGAGIIIQTGERVHGLTTAAAVWTIAAIGVLAGLGLFEFAAVSTLFIVGLLYIFRNIELKKAKKD